MERRMLLSGARAASAGEMRERAKRVAYRE